MIARILLLITTFSYYCTFSQEQTVYLIGDAGEYKYPGIALQALKAELDSSAENSIVIFLGDNIYPRGAPTSDGYIEKINSQLGTVTNYAGTTYFVPGNHDWKNGRFKGKSSIIEQQNYIDSYLYSVKSKGGFYPKNALPGPSVFEIGMVRVILIDTQWMFQDKWFNPVAGPARDSVFWNSFEKALDQTKEGQKVVVAAHHPLFSIGPHGKRMQPLRFISHYLFPLNIIGLDRLFAQDIPQPAYSRFRNRMRECIENSNIAEDVFYAAGHEHSLQYQMDKELGFHHIVSGSGSKKTTYKSEIAGKRTNRKSNQLFPSSKELEDGKNTALGYVKIEFYRNQKPIISFLEFYDTDLSETVRFQDGKVIEE